jgi:hypothetical protein
VEGRLGCCRRCRRRSGDGRRYRAAFLIAQQNEARWAFRVPWTRSVAIRTGSLASNVLAVRLAGSAASFYINGTKVGQIHGDPPKPGWFSGIIAQTASTEPNDTTWRFGRYGVVSTGATILTSFPGAPQGSPSRIARASATCPMDGATVRETFDRDSHSWDPLQSGVGIGPGYLDIKVLKKGHRQYAFNHRALRDGTICTTIYKTPTSSHATSGSAAGLAFWGVYTKADKNEKFYAFFLTPNGKFLIAQ